MTPTRISGKDRVILGLLGFFIVTAFTMELYWLIHSPTEMAQARDSNLFARLFDLYGASDRAYFEARTPFAICLELINVCFTQILNFALVYAIWKQTSWRHPLQLAVGAYVSYSVILYFLVGHVAGYDMREHTTGNLALFYGANAPWLLAHLYLVWDSAIAIRQRFAMGWSQVDAPPAS